MPHPSPSVVRRAGRVLRTSLFTQVACALVLGIARREAVAGRRHGRPAARRRLRPPDQGGHRAARLLRGRRGHRQGRGPEGVRPDRAQGADLVRGGDHGGADHRSARRQSRRPRHRYERRSRFPGRLGGGRPDRRAAICPRRPSSSWTRCRTARSAPSPRTPCSKSWCWPAWWVRPCCTSGKTKVPAILPAIEQAQQIVFAVVGFLMRLAPLAVFGAMAHLVGRVRTGRPVDVRQADRAVLRRRAALPRPARRGPQGWSPGSACGSSSATPARRCCSRSAPPPARASCRA